MKLNQLNHVDNLHLRSQKKKGLDCKN
ncbi:unnamed protein product [Coffea canephora]|uniref:DH200=94 genomic scaffold, scaffold_8312 n=1 Tax=Coffea canephora TaxID=49390 RepID=A0A068VME1_COFCA|nr:unnamed protein product [Coffea canephora]